MYEPQDLINIVELNKAIINDLENNTKILDELNTSQEEIYTNFKNCLESYTTDIDSKKYSLSIYPNYKCSADCYYCEMKKQSSGELSKKDVAKFLIRNINNIHFDQIKLVTGEDIDVRYSWVKFLSRYFKSINLATKLICETDLDWLCDICNSYNVVLNISYTTIENLNRAKNLLKYITSIEFVLNNKSLYELKDVVKWCTDNFVRLNVIPEVNITHESNKLNYQDVYTELTNIDNECGLIMINQYRNVAYEGGDRCEDINKLMIDPYGDIYCCSACSTFFKSNPESDSFGNINDYQLDDMKQNKITEIFDVNTDCDNCNDKCPAKCSVYKMNDETFNNMCVFYKVLYKLTKDLNISRSESMLPFLTSNCTTYCSYCFEHDVVDDAKKNMLPGILLSCIKYAILTDQFFEISLFGGEPTLNVNTLECLCDFLENRCRYDKLSISIQSNLVYINDRVFNIFKRLQKCATFRIDTSIDGCKAAHDLYRKNRLGEGSYDKVIENIKKIKTELPDIKILAKGVLTKNIIPYFTESLMNIIDLRRDGLIDDYMYTWYKGDNPEMIPDDDDLQKMVDEYFNVIIPYTESQNFSVGELGVAPLGLDCYFASSEIDDRIYLTEHTRDSNSRTHIVSPDGTILPCDMFTDEDMYRQFGNYPNILFDGHFKKSLNIKEYIDTRNLECFDCGLNYYCSRYMNHFKYQYDSQLNNIECSRRKKLLKMTYPYLVSRNNTSIINKLIDVSTYSSISKESIMTIADTILRKKSEE